MILVPERQFRLLIKRQGITYHIPYDTIHIARLCHHLQLPNVCSSTCSSPRSIPHLIANNTQPYLPTPIHLSKSGEKMTQLLRRVGEPSTTVSRPESEPKIEGSNNHEDPDGMIFRSECPIFPAYISDPVQKNTQQSSKNPNPVSR